MAGEEGDPAHPSREEGSPDEGEQIDESTPSGKKFAQMRADKKAAEEKAATAERERDLAKAREDALKEALSKAEAARKDGGKKEIPKPPVATAPEDEEYVAELLRKRGLDDETIAALKLAKDLPKQTQALVQQQLVDRACAALEKRWKDSVPFDRDAVIEYATKNNVPGNTVEEILDLAHQRLNEEKILDFKIEQRKKQVKSPKIESSGTGKKEIRQDKPTSTAGFRKMAHDMVGS